MASILPISISKMLVVVLFFMHGRYEKAITWIFIAAGLIWFLIMVDLTLTTISRVAPEPVRLAAR